MHLTWLIFLMTPFVVDIIQSSISPFFFLCQYHGPLHTSGIASKMRNGGLTEIELSVEIDGNPEFYEPGKPYKVAVTSSSDFDGFMMTGLYTLPEVLAKQNLAISGMIPRTVSNLGVSTISMDILCSIVHSQVSQRPKKKVAFLWIAPPTGSGCVYFIATGTLGHQIVFKDIVAFQICEQGDTTNDKLSLLASNEHGVILREDFENASSTQLIWKDAVGVDISNDCHSGMTSNTVSRFCQSKRQFLTSIPLNLTSTSFIQFTTAADNCSNEISNSILPTAFTVMFGLGQCKKWTAIQNISVFADMETKIHLVPLPNLAQKENVCLKWLQEDTRTDVCWTLDNVLVVNSADLPAIIWEQFSPLDPGNFLLFSGGSVKRKCQSDGNALIFNVPKHISRLVYATTRDFKLLQLGNNNDIIMYQGFDGDHATDKWLIEGGNISQQCGIVHHKKAVVFPNDAVLQQIKPFAVKLCSPFFDATAVGALKFHLLYGSGGCNVTVILKEYVSIEVYAELHAGIEVPMREITFSGNAKSQLHVIPVQSRIQTAKTRFCWRQHLQPTLNKGFISSLFSRQNDVPYMPWAVDSVSFMPSHPSEINHVIQFKVNTACSTTKSFVNRQSTSIMVEYSNDYGQSWNLIQSSCLLTHCKGIHVPLSSVLDSPGISSKWMRVTYPLPYASILHPTRIRFQHVGRSDVDYEWAIDDVFIGVCTRGCHGHGQCTPSGCTCDLGYAGLSCNVTTVSYPETIFEKFSSEKLHSETRQYTIEGAEFGYQCGILSHGKAVVFNKAGHRTFSTSELNTTEARFLEFTVRLGGNGKSSTCSAPRHSSSGIYVHSSCIGGVKWNLIQYLQPSDFSGPKHMSISLPSTARGASCKFRIWQPSHSGPHRDVWAIDDISIGGKLLNSIYIDFSDSSYVKDTLTYSSGVLGFYCNNDETLRIRNERNSSSIDYASVQSVETKSLDVGPAYMLQFDLAINCHSEAISHNIDDKVTLEYSTDHGQTWNVLQETCLPPSAKCSGMFTQGTHYYALEYKDWKRVTIRLPTHTWSPATRFRLVQNTNNNVSWALDNLYVGPECPDLCSGHGYCANGTCKCDHKFLGPTCLPKEKLPNEVNGSMTSERQILLAGFEFVGGEIITDFRDTFGIIASGAAIHFNKNGVRQLVTPDMHTRNVETVQFFLQVGQRDDLINISIKDVELFTGSLACQDGHDAGILLQFSNDAGGTWHLLKQFFEEHYGRQSHLELVPLPDDARTNCTRMRWWQPIPAVDDASRVPWALDEIIFVELSSKKTLFEHTTGKRSRKLKNAMYTVHTENDHNRWAFHTTVSQRRFCHSDEPVLVFDGPELHRFAITKEITLVEGNVIQFEISIGCTDTFLFVSPVHLEYSHDGGMSWNYVKDECYPQSALCGIYGEASIYYMGTHGQWTLVVLNVSKRIASANRVSFRWSQKRTSNVSVADGAFALKNIYIGHQCPDFCYGNGFCSYGSCVCDDGYQGSSCTSVQDNPSNITDKFDELNPKEPRPLWQSIYGGSIGNGCGVLSAGNSLYFNGTGTREARTVALDTRKIRSIKFFLRLGWRSDVLTCRLATKPDETIILQFSTTNGLMWHDLEQFSYKSFSVYSNKNVSSSKPKAYRIDLPSEARTLATSFRWWQPFGLSLLDSSTNDTRTSWAIDSVVFAAEDTTYPTDFFEDFTVVNTEFWLMIYNATFGRYCNSEGKALYFQKSQEDQFIETEDFQLNAASFLQFDLVINCQKKYSSTSPLHVRVASSFAVQLEYSVDRGHSWSLVQDNCLISSPHSISTYYADVYWGRWTRVTVSLPPRAMTSATRFRWKRMLTTPLDEDENIQGLLEWAIDNVYLGHHCPWMCSGHGQCRNGNCICDVGFEGIHCVAAKPLPSTLRDSFDEDVIVDSDVWYKVYGATIDSRLCGVLVSKSALVFNGENTRMATTHDLDLLNALYVQFTIKFGCGLTINEDQLVYLRTNFAAVLVQYSNNGGITWQLLQEIAYVQNRSSVRYIIDLKHFIPVRTNCTRLRFWQPQYRGDKKDFQGVRFNWGIDGFLVGGSLFPPNILHDNFFGKIPRKEVWLDWPGSLIATFCNSDSQALVFSERRGERAAYTTDVQVSEDSVIQFEIKVGCGLFSSQHNPVLLEYSTDFGQTWKLVQDFDHTVHDRWFDDVDVATQLIDTPTVFFANAEGLWKRVVIPLSHLDICGSARFRWFQGYFPSDVDELATWGLDNVYIGPACLNNCHGHGMCIDGVLCQCSAGFNGSTCENRLKLNSKIVKEDFERTTTSNFMTDTDPTVVSSVGAALALRSSVFWDSVSGAEISKACGTLFTGSSLVFGHPGSRCLISQELNLSLTSTIQFYLRLGCEALTANWSHTVPPVLLHYSTDGGIFWTLLEKFYYTAKRSTTAFVSLEIPEEARVDSTKFRWSQLSMNGIFGAEWAIDEVYIGHDLAGLLALHDDFKVNKSANWISTSGALLQPVCGQLHNSLHFVGNDDERFAVTVDIMVKEESFIQFELLMGCRDSSSCYSIDFEYSLDAGRSWSLVFEKCLPFETSCTVLQDATSYFSDLYLGRQHRVSFMLPYYTFSHASRFRWIQKSHFQVSDTWALGAVYIGDECQEACHGRGLCDGGTCKCDDGWHGKNCEVPKSSLPTHVREEFSSGSGISKTHWSKIRGGVISDLCGSVGSGSALHFYGHCSRLLETVPLDLRGATDVRFNFRFGCITPATLDHRQSVFVQYSVNAGMKWFTLIELENEHHHDNRLVKIVLPSHARSNGVSLRWWQPEHGGSTQSDWALDNVVVSGLYSVPTLLMDLVNGTFTSYLWSYKSNMYLSHFCDSGNDVAVSEVLNGAEDAVLETVDVQTASASGYVLEFNIVIGCRSSAEAEPNYISTVHLQYSTDKGSTWHYVLTECVVGDSLGACSDRIREGKIGAAGAATIFYSSLKWVRTTIPLFGRLVSSSIRFRWIQFAFLSDSHATGSKMATRFTNSFRWGLQNVYIGPGSPQLCHGHGSSLTYPNCRCDDGYEGSECNVVTKRLPDNLRDTFNVNSIDATNWNLLLGGSLSSTRQFTYPLLDGNAIIFDRCGSRILESADLDLRDAKFIHYVAVFGQSGNALCASHRKQSLFLQYSPNGGIAWHGLHEMVPTSYLSPVTEHIILPAEARTSPATRLRWWQSTVECTDDDTIVVSKHSRNNYWIIDRVLVGGCSINPAELHESFEERNYLPSTNWWFVSGGKAMKGFCDPKVGQALVWETPGEDKARRLQSNLVSRELIIGDNYVLRFKIVVGCFQDKSRLCNSADSTVHLEYRTDQMIDKWSLVKRQCLPRNAPTTSECLPNNYHDGSSYKPVIYNQWTQVMISLPRKTISETTQFRWRLSQSAKSNNDISWAIDDVHIGEACSDDCNIITPCVNTKEDDYCQKLGWKNPLQPNGGLFDDFEDAENGDDKSGRKRQNWFLIIGGRPSHDECGHLTPSGYGNHLYFNGCGSRQAVTSLLDLRLAKSIIFILRIGSTKQSKDCNVNLTSPDVPNKSILVQYSLNRGDTWKLIAMHEPHNFLMPRSVIYDIPADALASEVQLRWWQPQHAGPNSDQWALDNIEFVV